MTSRSVEHPAGAIADTQKTSYAALMEIAQAFGAAGHNIVFALRIDPGRPLSTSSMVPAMAVRPITLSFNVLGSLWFR